MSSSLLYHGFNVRGYRYLKTEFVDGAVIFHLEYGPTLLKCVQCQSSHVIRRGAVPRLLRTVPIGSKPVWLQLDVPRLECHDCGAVRQARQTLADPKRRHTRAFMRHALELSRRMTLKDVATHLGTSWDTIKDIQEDHLRRRYGKPRLKGVRRLAIDEISIGKGHRYLTVVLDWDQGLVLHVGEGKGQDALAPFWRRLRPSGAQVQAVAIDMSPAYIAAVRKNLPGADIVYDRFHIMQLLHDKLTTLRRQLHRQLTDGPAKDVLKGARWLLLKRPENLDPDRHEAERLQEALRLNEPLATAYYLKEDLRQFWEQPHKTAARDFLTSWIVQATCSGVRVLRDFSRTLFSHADGILTWYKHPISTGPLEGVNNKIQTMKRQAYGYSDLEFLKLKIYALHETKYALVG